MSGDDKPKTPEGMAREYCKQFGEWDLTLGGRALMHRIFLAGYARGKADALEWIPTNERPPEVGATVLIYVRDYYDYFQPAIFLAWRANDHWRAISPSDNQQVIPKGLDVQLWARVKWPEISTNECGDE